MQNELPPNVQYIAIAELNGPTAFPGYPKFNSQ